MKTTQTELQKIADAITGTEGESEANPITVGNGNEIYARGVAP